jgi:hypothetical protein
MALLDVDFHNTWREVDEVEVRLAALRSAIADARRNGWRESEHLGDEMESFLAAQVPIRALQVVRPEFDHPGAARNNWRQ